MTDAIVINGHRTPTTVQRRDGGGVLLRQGHRYVALDATEFERVVDFLRDEPQLGQLARFPVTPPAAPSSDELNWVE